MLGEAVYSRAPLAVQNALVAVKGWQFHRTRYRSPAFRDADREWLRNERLTCEELRQVQFRRLQKFVEHCWRNSPYYSEKLKQAKFSPADLRSTFAALSLRIRPAGWLVFDVHTDAMMAFTVSRPVVRGEEGEHRFVISSVVDTRTRTCDTRIEVVPLDGGGAFSEHHRQHFHRAADMRASLVDAGFEVTAVRDGYSERPADASVLSATWIARRASGGASRVRR